MSNNKIVFLSTFYFSKIHFRQLEMSKYLKNKIKVEIWYLNKLVNRNYKIKEFKNGFKKIKIKKVNNFIQLEKLIQINNSGCVYDLKIPYNFASKKLLQTLSKYRVRYLVHLMQGSNIYHKNIKLNDYIKLQLKKLFSKNFLNIKNALFNKFFLLFSSNFWKIGQASYVYLVGKSAYDNRFDNKLVNNKTKLILGHHRNYDDYLSEKNKVIKLKQKNALFIDQQVPFHPELKELGLSDIKPEIYYNSIKKFLEKINKVLGYRIEISCHPKCNVKKLKKFFPNFKIKINDTINQIRSSKLVMTHESTAIDFAILYKKPLLFVTNNILNKSSYPHFETIKAKANHLNKTPINIDICSIKDIKKNISSSKFYYTNYLRNFIKLSKKEKSQAILIIERFKKDKLWV